MVVAQRGDEDVRSVGQGIVADLREDQEVTVPDPASQRPGLADRGERIAGRSPATRAGARSPGAPAPEERLAFDVVDDGREQPAPGPVTLTGSCRRPAGPPRWGRRARPGPIHEPASDRTVAARVRS